MLDLDHLHVVPAKYTGGHRSSAPTLIVIHTGETSERPNSAEGMAAFFAAGPDSKASTQIVCDNDSIVRCVPDDVIAYGTSGGANAYALHIELAGRAEQTSIEWADPFSRATMANAARVVAAWARRHRIPVLTKLDGKDMAADVRAGRNPRGICGHIDVTTMATALGHTNRGHWDPGPGFPWNTFLAMVADELDAPFDPTHTGPPVPVPPASTTMEEPTMRLVTVVDAPAADKGKVWAVTPDGSKVTWISPLELSALQRVFGPLDVLQINAAEFAGLTAYAKHFA